MYHVNLITPPELLQEAKNVKGKGEGGNLKV